MTLVMFFFTTNYQTISYFSSQKIFLNNYIHKERYFISMNSLKLTEVNTLSKAFPHFLNSGMNLSMVSER